MTGLEVITLSVMIAACLFLLFFFFFLFLLVQTNKEIKKSTRRRVREPKQKRQLAKKRRVLYKKKKQLKKSVMTFLALSIFLLSGSGASAYYQAKTLSKEDEDSVVKGYFLLNDFEEQLELAKNKNENKAKIDGNLRYLASAISSYGAKKSSSLNSEEGQLTLNRYYKAMQDVGLNAMRLTKGFYGENELVEEYLNDIKRVKIYQEKVFNLYQVDEQALAGTRK